MGTLSSHLGATIGSTASDDAKAEAIRLFNESFSRLGVNFDKAAGDDPFALLALVQEFNLQVSNGGVQVNTHSAPAPVAALGTGAPTKPATPSKAEQLGEKLLGLYGDNAAQADTALTFLERASAGGSDLHKYLVVTTERVLKGADSVATRGRELVLLSHKNDKDLLDTTKDVVEELLDYAIVDDVDKTELNNALKAAKALKVKAAAPASPVPNTDLTDFLKKIGPELKVTLKNDVVADQLAAIDAAKKATANSVALEKQVKDAKVVANKNGISTFPADAGPHNIWLAIRALQEHNTTSGALGGEKRPSIIV